MTQTERSHLAIGVPGECAVSNRVKVRGGLCRGLASVECFLRRCTSCWGFYRRAARCAASGGSGLPEENDDHPAAFSRRKGAAISVARQAGFVE